VGVGKVILPADLEKSAGLRFVELRKIRIQPGFDRAFAQDPGAERMNGPDERVPNVGDGGAHPLADDLLHPNRVVCRITMSP
jgi:hypothetical protein